ncbi:MAG TPA: hypothetical protein VMP03_14830, partial [Methylomirabilota bacterium]|nr:hypothetical protein [Methylomirabilota bacterium]
VGAQIYYIETTQPEAFARTTAIVSYPGYWGFRLSGVLGTDVTSLGCHTDIWNPNAHAPSSLAVSRGWAARFAPVRTPFDRLGGLTASVAAATGLREGLPVFQGIHDSNASLLPHLLARQAPFAVISTGTWAILFAVGSSSADLDPARDTLCNIDAFGRPVPSARFMAGREFDILTDRAPVTPSAADVRSVIDGRAMALPTFAPRTGPFGHSVGRWSVDPGRLGGGERTAAASLYAALVTEKSLDLIGAAGPIVVEGPFAANRVYSDAVAALTGRDVVRAAGATGTSAGAALVAAGPSARRATPPEIRDATPPTDLSGLDDYARQWRTAVKAV